MMMMMRMMIMRMMKKMVRLTFMSLPLAIMPKTLVFTAFFALCTTACGQPCRYYPPNHPPTHPPTPRHNSKTPKNAQKRRKTEVNTRCLEARLATTTTTTTTTTVIATLVIAAKPPTESARPWRGDSEFATGGCAGTGGSPAAPGKAHQSNSDRNS